VARPSGKGETDVEYGCAVCTFCVVVIIYSRAMEEEKMEQGSRRHEPREVRKGRNESELSHAKHHKQEQ
jgi:hypothetical protein